MTTFVLAVEGMHCASCGLLIDDTLDDLPGVLHAQTRYRDARTTVTVDPSRATLAQVIAAIAEAGYPATAVQP